MAIRVFVDRANRPFVQYVLDTFERVTNSSVDFQVCDSALEVAESVQPTIFYGQKPARFQGRCIEIPCRTLYESNRYIWLEVANPSPITDTRLTDGHIPVFEKSTADFKVKGEPLLIERSMNRVLAEMSGEGEIRLGFDLLYNAFVHLSCLEEWERERQNGPVHSYASRVGKDRRIYEKPVVNYLFALLENLLALAMDVRREKIFPYRPGFSVCLTHDVDAVEKTLMIRFKQSAFIFFNAVQQAVRGRMVLAWQDVRRGLGFLLGPGDYWQFDRIQELERQHGFNSTFNVYIRTRVNGWRERINRLVFDPGYNVVNHDRLQDRLRALGDEGWEIGLHGSFDSFVSAARLRQEKEELERYLGRPVSGGRQHWARLSLAETFGAQAEAGLSYDTTLGFNDQYGFRAGLATCFYPYDHLKRTACTVLEVPWVLMDSTIYDYHGWSAKEGLPVVLRLLEEVARFNGCVSIVWHQRVFSPDYSWEELYEEILLWLAERGGRGLPVEEAYRQWIGG